MSLRRPQIPVLLFVLLLTTTHASGQEKNQPYVEIPTEVMNSQLTTITGKQLRLADYHDRTVIVNIFATWAHPALLNLKELTKLKKHYKKSEIEIIGLSSDKNEKNFESLREFVRLTRINFEIVWESGDFAASLVKAVNAPTVIPQTFVIDTQGRIRKHFMGYNRYSTARLMCAAVDESRLEQGKATTSR